MGTRFVTPGRGRRCRGATPHRGMLPPGRKSRPRGFVCTRLADRRESSRLVGWAVRLRRAIAPRQSSQWVVSGWGGPNVRPPPPVEMAASARHHGGFPAAHYPRRPVGLSPALPLGLASRTTPRWLAGPGPALDRGVVVPWFAVRVGLGPDGSGAGGSVGASARGSVAVAGATLWICGPSVFRDACRGGACSQ